MRQSNNSENERDERREDGRSKPGGNNPEGHNQYTNNSSSHSSVAALRRAAVRTLPAAASAARVLPAVARAARAVGKTALRAADRTTTIRRVTTSTRGTTRAASLPVSSVFGPTRRESPLFEKRIARFSFLFGILKFKIMHYLCMRNPSYRSIGRSENQIEIAIVYARCNSPQR